MKLNVSNMNAATKDALARIFDNAEINLLNPEGGDDEWNLDVNPDKQEVAIKLIIATIKDLDGVIGEIRTGIIDAK